MEKTAILAVSFGTSFPDTREKTIDRIEADMRNAFPACPVYRAWTSKRILKKIADRDGIRYDTVPEALERILRDGYDTLVVQPTHVIPAIENDGMLAEVEAMHPCFRNLYIGKPLLSDPEDKIAVAQILEESFGSLEKGEALVLMGHGTPHRADSVYEEMNQLFADRGVQHVYVGTVEGIPSLDTLLERVKQGSYHTVHMMPLMLVAGDHANHDMAGEDDASWKSRFEAEGYRVVCHMKGLGEYPGVRKIYLEHLKTAAGWDRE